MKFFVCYLMVQCSLTGWDCRKEIKKRHSSGKRENSSSFIGEMTNFLVSNPQRQFLVSLFLEDKCTTTSVPKLINC